MTKIKDFVLPTHYCAVGQFIKANTQNKRNAKRTDRPTTKFCITLVFIQPTKFGIALYSKDNNMLFSTILTNKNEIVFSSKSIIYNLKLYHYKRRIKENPKPVRKHKKRKEKDNNLLFCFFVIADNFLTKSTADNTRYSVFEYLVRRGTS